MSCEKIHPVVIIGSGPAGFSAGLYAARAELKPLLFQGLTQPGGQLTTTSTVENYLGLDEINGFDLTEKFRTHAEHYGVDILAHQIVSVDTSSFPYLVVDETGAEYRTQSIIIATGATARRLGLPSEERLWNNGVSACAVCDGALPLFRKKPLAVIGGGDTAFEEALFLTKFASKVYLVHRRDTFRASRILVERAKRNPQIEFILDSVAVDVHGGEIVDGLTIKNLKTHEETKFAINGLFYAIGHVPNTAFLQTEKSSVRLDEDGYIVTDPGSTQTNVAGVFACGDVQDKRYRQAITSAGSGCMAALDANEWLFHQ